MKPESQEAKALGSQFQALRDRLKKKSYYLCRPIYIGEEKNSMIGVFEYVHGRSLEDWMREGLSQEQCVRLALALANAIRILHRAGIAHLDLKPRNVLVEEKQGCGQLFLRLIDTDAAQIDGVGLRPKPIGTPGNASPEHFLPDHFGGVSTRSDVFTLGILLFQLLFKKHPFPVNDSVNDYKIAVQNSNVEVPPNRYHREVVERIVTCLETDPQRRPMAGWVHSTLHKHLGTNFEAADETDRWISGRVSLESGEFRRVYYYGTHLGRSNFRGSGMPQLPSKFLHLYLTVKGVLVELTDARVDVLVSGDRLEQAHPRPLRTGDSLTIDGKQFTVTVDS